MALIFHLPNRRAAESDELLSRTSQVAPSRQRASELEANEIKMQTGTVQLSPRIRRRCAVR